VIVNLTDAKESGSNGRLCHLDALRGIAAMCVVFSHLFGLNTEYPSWGMLGGAPVTFFFLLSGYVLGKSLASTGTRPFEDGISYCIRRLFRLYPAIFVTLIIAAILAKFYVIPVSSDGLSQWFAKSLIKGTQVHGIHDYLGSFRLYYIRLDPPLWTIQIEFVCSLLLPLLVWPTKGNAIARWGLLIILGYWKIANPSWIPAWMHMASHLFEFYLGYIAWTLYSKVSGIPPQKSKKLIVGCILISLTWMLFIDPSSSGIIFTLGMGAFLALAGPCRWDGMKRHLNSAPLQFLGRISYSLYLVHLPILLFFWSIIYGKHRVYHESVLVAIVLTIVVLPTSLLVSGAIECFIERPFNNFGHKISQVLKMVIQKTLS